jgi:transcriptional regulator GlxA family with amidase domain
MSLARHHSVTGLAHDLNLSASRLEHLFKHYTGRCLREHIIQSRVRQAERLLKTTAMSVKEIAAQVGYAHAPSFIRVFTGVCGQSPQRFRIAGVGRTGKEVAEQANP